MRSTHANPRHRRHGSSAITVLAALLALAGAAIAPATAAAMVDQSTETGTRCIQVMPGVYLALFPGESCEPERPGEVIRIHDPYKPPACSPLEHRCGLPDEGRAPQPPRPENGFGPGPGRGRGPGAAPTKPKPKPKPKPKSDPGEELAAKCRGLQDKLMSEPPSGSELSQITQAEKDLASRRGEISLQIANLFKDDQFAGRIRELSKSVAWVHHLTLKIAELQLQYQTRRSQEFRAEWNAKGCGAVSDRL